MVGGSVAGPGLTEPRLRRVLMLCFPLSPSSSSLTGLNIKGGGSTGFSMGGSSPYFLKWMRQSVQSRMFSRPPWCQSLEAARGKRGGAKPQTPVSWGHLSRGLNPGAMRTAQYWARADAAQVLVPPCSLPGEHFRNPSPLMLGSPGGATIVALAPTMTKSVLPTDQHSVLTSRGGGGVK